MLQEILVFGEIVSLVIACTTLASILIKPIREKLFNSNVTKEGERCLLRSQMLDIYYKNEEKQEIRQYELENFVKLYEAYKALGGNSFIDEVNEAVKEWTIKR